MTLQEHTKKILQLLASNKNVLLVGPPATGKSKLIEEISNTFQGGLSPALMPASPVPVPATRRTAEPWLPSYTRIKRKVFAITFHQGTKHRQFVSGIIPELRPALPPGFRVTTGLLMDANQFAIEEKGASLLSIDEINRGPAVSIFGDTLTSIEPDKRLNENDQQTPASSPFYAYDSTTGVLKPFFLSPHLYMLATMNEADTSVEPLDVAFLRRFSVYRLLPEVETARTFLNLPIDPSAPLGNDTALLYESLVSAWNSVNKRISLGRSPAFQIGHGILMRSPPPSDLPNAQLYAAECWRRIEAHVQEVFFANDTAQASVFNAKQGSHYELVEGTFDEQPVSRLHFKTWQPQDILSILKQVLADAT